MNTRDHKLKVSANALLLSLYLLLSAPAANAAMGLALDLRQLVSKADYILVATVQRQTARWNKYGRIVTDVALEVQESLKGEAAAGDELTVTALGGNIGDLVMHVEGSPRFISGASVVVFLRRAPSLDELHVVGMSQGVLYLADGPYGQVILPGGQGQALVQSDPSVEKTDEEEVLSEPILAFDLLSKIRRIVAEQSSVK
jgi:hypothetical protein